MKLYPTQGEAPHACPPPTVTVVVVVATAAAVVVVFHCLHAPYCLAQTPAASFHSSTEQWH